ELTNQERGGVLPDSRRRYEATREDAQLMGKLTYTHDARNRFTLTAYTLPSTSGGSNRMAIDPMLGKPTYDNVAGTPDALFNTVVTNTTSVQADWDTETASK